MKRRSELDGLVEGTMMLAFEDTTLPPGIRAVLESWPVAGVTLGRYRNVESAEQVRELTAALQTATDAPLLVAIDQEGGQLLGLGESSTPFAGNMALGATGDSDLAFRVARAVGRELRAAGVNVNYAPVCDVATNPSNPSLGIRSFGDDPASVAELVFATVRGLQAEGVAATLKHFPGLGEAAIDPHVRLPRLDLDHKRLEAVELVPFRAGIAAGARLLMVGHCALPVDPPRPASLSQRVIQGLVRGVLAYRGVVITDALDMGAVGEGGPRQEADVVAAAGAGADLLLLGPGGHGPARAALRNAASRGLLGRARLAASSEQVAELKRWVGRFGQPGLEVVACAEHLELAREVAERSVTLVRDDAGLLPLRLQADARVAVVMPLPADLTPADTSSTVQPTLARTFRARHPHVEEFLVDHEPSAADIAALRERAVWLDLLVVGTTDAFLTRAQASLVSVLLETGVPAVTVALRAPFDLAAYPQATTHACTYGILEPQMEALAAALWGRAPFRGRLPASIPGLHPTGHGLLR